MGGRPGRRGGGHGGLWFWNVAHPLGTAPGWWIGLAAGIGQTAVFGGGGGPLQLPVGQGDPGSSSCPHYTPGPCSPEAGGGCPQGGLAYPHVCPASLSRSRFLPGVCRSPSHPQQHSPAGPRPDFPPSLQAGGLVGSALHLMPIPHCPLPDPVRPGPQTLPHLPSHPTMPTRKWGPQQPQA